MPEPVFVISQSQNSNVNIKNQILYLEDNQILGEKDSIYQNYEITFYNQQILQEYNITKKEDILHKFLQTKLSQQVKVLAQEKNSSNDKLITKNNLNLQYQSNLISEIKEDIVKAQENAYLIDIQTQTTLHGNQYQFIQEKIYQHCLLKDENESTKEKYYDIKSIQCIWQDKPSILIILKNINKKIKINKLKEINKYKSSILASVTHDIKNPLNGIMTMLQSSQHLYDVEQIKLINQIALKNSQLLLSLVNDILDYSQILNGKLRIIPIYFSLQQLIKEVYTLFQFISDQKGIQLRINNIVQELSIQEESSNCYSDENRIKQILINLIGNAVKFTYQGYINVNYTFHAITNCFLIEVQDTGVGIPINIQSQLFSEFKTFDDKRGSNKQGVGLGLCICKKIVGLLGPFDQIQLESVEEQGSKFSFHIYKNIINKQINEEIQICSPIIHLNSRKKINSFYDSLPNLQQTQQLQSEQFIQYTNDIDEIKRNEIHQNINQFNTKYISQEFKQINRKSSLDQLQNIENHNQKDYIIHQIQSFFQNKITKILFVDDDHFNIFGFQCLLKPIKNIEIAIALNGIQAIQQIQQAEKQLNQYQYIFMDVNMPRMNGIDAILQIRQLEKENLISPVCIISLIGDKDDRKKCLNAGANTVIDKPLSYNELLSVIMFVNNILEY